ncbi:MAG TPA: hypothetical protein VD790_09595 [Thermoleophilaceae bacterium]|nr:hypothetical protein [Thermoleophilaceae bacterium]
MGGARYLGVIAAALAFGACGGDSGPDVPAVERALAEDVEVQTGTEDVAVECAEDVGEGDVCSVSAAGGVKAEVRVTRIDGDEADGEVVQP